MQHVAHRGSDPKPEAVPASHTRPPQRPAILDGIPDGALVAVQTAVDHGAVRIAGGYAKVDTGASVREDVPPLLPSPPAPERKPRRKADNPGFGQREDVEQAVALGLLAFGEAWNTCTPTDEGRNRLLAWVEWGAALAAHEEAVAAEKAGGGQ